MHFYGIWSNFKAFKQLGGHFLFFKTALSAGKRDGPPFLTGVENTVSLGHRKEVGPVEIQCPAF
jgi:hypothetical protein